MKHPWIRMSISFGLALAGLITPAAADTSKDTRADQECLKRFAFYTGPIDGRWGQQSQAALDAWALGALDQSQATKLKQLRSQCAVVSTPAPQKASTPTARASTVQRRLSHDVCLVTGFGHNRRRLHSALLTDGGLFPAGDHRQRSESPPDRRDLSPQFVLGLVRAGLDRVLCLGVYSDAIGSGVSRPRHEGSPMKVISLFLILTVASMGCATAPRPLPQEPPGASRCRWSLFGPRPRGHPRARSSSAWRWWRC